MRGVFLHVIIAAVGIACLATGCSHNKSGAAPPSAVGGPSGQSPVASTTDFTGTWAGKTSQGFDIQFLVEENKVTSCIIQWVYAGQLNRTFRNLDQPVTDNAFSAAKLGCGITVTGEFKDWDKAVGVLIVEESKTGSPKITWKAELQSRAPEPLRPDWMDPSRLK